MCANTQLNRLLDGRMRSSKLQFLSFIRNTSQRSTRCAGGDLIGLDQRVQSEGQQNGPTVEAATAWIAG